MNKFFSGLRVYIPLTEKYMPKGLPGCTVRIVRRLPATSRIHTTLGRTDLTWQGVVIRAPNPAIIGKEVYFNENVGIPLQYDGAEKAHITLVQLLRTCHADPEKILGGL